MSQEECSYLRMMNTLLVEEEAKARDVLPPEKLDFFVQVEDDWLDVTEAVRNVHWPENDLLFEAVTNFGKEIRWFQFLFLSGHYSLLLGRLRFIWEASFRAYFVDAGMRSRSLTPAGGAITKKRRWLERYGQQLNWNRCIEPVFRAVYPGDYWEPKLLAPYKARWDYLHRHVHPAAHFAERRPSAADFFSCGNFDEDWANETVAVATDVFELVWLAVLTRYPVDSETLVVWCPHSTLGLGLSRISVE